MSDSKIFSLEGKGLKLDSAADIDPHIQALKENENVEEVRFLGNTLGIGASEALAKVLESKKKLQVCRMPHTHTLVLSKLMRIPKLDRKLRRRLHRPPPLRNPPSPLPPPNLPPHPPATLHNQPLRQRLRPKHPSPARRLPLSTRPSPPPNPQQQRPGPRSRRPHRRRPHYARREKGSCEERWQRRAEPRDRHLRTQSSGEW